MKKNYQLGLLHVVHSLINVDGRIDDREMETLMKIKNEENIDDTVFLEFSRSIARTKSPDIFKRGVDLLKACKEEEKICAFVYLFKLAEADESISMKEVKLLMNALELTDVDFKDVAITTDLASSSDKKKRKQEN